MIKLSEAIIKGSKNRTQTIYKLYDGKSVCALGAACFGVGITPRKGSKFSNRLLKVFPYLGRLTHEDKTLADEIVTHNDDDGWSFKHIASWLRELGH